MKLKYKILTKLLDNKCNIYHDDYIYSYFQIRYRKGQLQILTA